MEILTRDDANTLKNCRNPLSLDMGWKLDMLKTHVYVYSESQSAFAGYGLEIGDAEELGILDPLVAIRFRWIWVGNLARLMQVGLAFESQSAFAGYGLEIPKKRH